MSQVYIYPVTFTYIYGGRWEWQQACAAKHRDRIGVDYRLYAWLYEYQVHGVCFTSVASARTGLLL
jgi:hypothetical protein